MKVLQCETLTVLTSLSGNNTLMMMLIVTVLMIKGKQELEATKRRRTENSAERNISYLE